MNRVIERQMDVIRAALTEDKLLERAVLDAIAAFARFATVDRSRSESIRLLRTWEDVFRRQADEKTRR